MFDALYRELAPWKASPYKRSVHPACVDEQCLLRSPTYRAISAELCRIFGMRVGYSIVNLYANGDDWTDYHRDKYKVEGGNRLSNGSVEEPEPHNATVGVSFGAERELRFKHLQTGLEFSFPQFNGDVFAFLDPVNSAFQHCVPRVAPAAAVGPRISLILWGRMEHGCAPASSAARPSPCRACLGGDCCGSAMLRRAAASAVATL